MISGARSRKKPWERRVTIVVNCDRWRRVHESLLGREYFGRRIKREVDFVIRKLGLKKHHAILDIPCGSGRHAAELAGRGYDVTGVDLSRACLSEARRRKGSWRIGGNLKFEARDILKLDRRYKNHFDVILTLFSAYGFMSDDKGNDAALKNLVRCLKPGGHICFRTMDLDYIYRHHQPQNWTETKDYFYLNENEFYEKRKYVSMDWIIISKEDGSAKRYFNWLRAYGKGEFVSRMKRCGLGRIRVFGGYDGGRYRKGVSRSPIFIGQKK